MEKLRVSKELIITAIIFILIFAMRIPYINNSPAERGDMWRQPDTESIARNFVEHRFNIFYPQFNYDGPLPNYVQLEFQVTTFITAILYRLFGHSYLWARLVPTLFFMLSVYYLYLLAKRVYSEKAAWFVIIIYGIIPLNLFYSRAIMPESALLFFLIGAFYHFVTWFEDKSILHLTMSGVLTALAISQKTPAVFIGLAMLGMCLWKYKFRFLRKWELWVFAIIALVPPFLYIRWSASIAEFAFVSSIAQKHIFPNLIRGIASPETWGFFRQNLPIAFTNLLLITSIIGLVLSRKKKELPIVFFALSMIVETILIVSIIKFEYYLIFLSPFVALLSGKALYEVSRRMKLGIVISGTCLVYVLITSIGIVAPRYEELPAIIHYAQFVNENTQPDDLIVIATFDPARLSLSSRRGWRANLRYYEHIPRDVEGEVRYFIDSGAKYFVVFNNYIYNDDGSYRRYLNENFTKKDFGNGYVFYFLRERIQ